MSLFCAPKWASVNVAYLAVPSWEAAQKVPPCLLRPILPRALAHGYFVAITSQKAIQYSGATWHELIVLCRYQHGQQQCARRCSCLRGGIWARSCRRSNF